MDESRSALQSMIGGFRPSRMISVAAELRLADHLKEGSKTPRELAERTGAHEDSLYRLLRTLAGIGIFAEGNDLRFRLTPLAEFLRSDIPGSLRVAAEVVGADWNWRSWGSLSHSVKTGETAFDHLYGENTWEWFSDHPTAAKLFDEYMEEISTVDALAVVAAYDFSAARTVVDVAGGRGALLIEILRRNQSARGILFNLPHVIESAQNGMEGEISQRIEFVPGDFFQVIPGGGDIYILKNILHDWSNALAREILANCQAAMQGHAMLLIIENIVCAPNQPCPGKAGDIQMMVRNGGRNRTEQEFRDLLGASGFHISRVIQTRGGPELLEASLQPLQRL